MLAVQARVTGNATRTTRLKRRVWRDDFGVENDRTTVFTDSENFDATAGIGATSEALPGALLGACKIVQTVSAIFPAQIVHGGLDTASIARRHAGRVEVQQELNAIHGNFAGAVCEMIIQNLGKIILDHAEGLLH